MEKSYPIPQNTWTPEEKKTTAKVLIPFILLSLFIFVLLGFYFLFYSYYFPSKKITPILASDEKDKKILANHAEKIAFLPSWSMGGEYTVDPRLFTQIIYFGLGVNPDGSLIKFNAENTRVIEWAHFISPSFTQLRNESKKNGTKLLISIKNFDNATIDSIISNPNATNLLIRQINEVVSTYALDGVNIDFEYVTDSNFPTRTYLAPFLEKLSNELKNNHPESIISFDINSAAILNDRAYDLTRIGKAVDQVIFMGYDYRRMNSVYSGPTAPLYMPRNQDSIDKSIRFLSNEVDKSKIILAVPLYGYEWQTNGYASQSAIISSSGALATYKRVHALLAENPTIQVNFDTTSQSSWFSYKQYGVMKQIWFEDEKSLSAKYKYMVKKNLGGVAFWALGYEGKNTDIWNLFK